MKAKLNQDEAVNIDIW